MKQESPDIFWFQEGEIKSFWSFILAINWTEKWLIGLVFFHLLCSLVIVFTRKHLNVQIGILCCLCAITMASEKVNEFGASNWKLFAKEQYFDSSGQFISVIWSAPVVINCLMLVIMWLVEVGQLLIKTKQRQLLRVKNSQRIQHEKTE